MPVVYAPLPVGIFVRSASLHVGATAVAAALRRDLVRSGYLSDEEFDEAYAAARLTPGTTLLALYVAIGYRLGGWRGATLALLAGGTIPAVMVTVVAIAYVINSGTTIAREAMQGASAAAIGVLFASVVKLVMPVLHRHRWRGVALAIATLSVSSFSDWSVMAVLLAAGVTSVVFLE